MLLASHSTPWGIWSSSPNGTGGVSGSSRCYLGSLVNLNRWITKETFGVFEQVSNIMYRPLLSLWETFLGLLLSLVETEVLRSPLSYHVISVAHHNLNTEYYPTHQVISRMRKPANPHQMEVLYIYDRTQAGPESPSKLHESVQMLMTSITVIIQSAPKHAHIASQGKLWKRWLRPCLMMILHSMQVSSASEQLQHYNQWKATAKANLHIGQNLGKCTWLCIFFKAEMTRCVIIQSFMGYSQWICWMVRALERLWLENWWERYLVK